MVFVNDFNGNTVNEKIENAIINRTEDGVVVFSANKDNGGMFLLDRAILLPENTTVVIDNCTIKLSDKCRDNFFRSANCGMGIDEPVLFSNIHIVGKGKAVLLGADRPRSTGDGGKTNETFCPYEVEDLIKHANWLTEEERKTGKVGFSSRHNHTFGTDAAVKDEIHNGDYRNIGILLARVKDFSIENLTIKEYHAWGISLEDCTFGRIEKIHFDARMWKIIDGVKQNIENQDGIDLRNGCNNIVISDITGNTGDDVVALTAIADGTFKIGGTFGTTHVLNNNWEKRSRDIHDIVIRNVVAASHLCYTLRLLAVNSKIYNIVADGIIDTNTVADHGGTVVIGEPDEIFGTISKGNIYNVCLSNIINNSRVAINVKGYLKDSIISNVINNSRLFKSVYVYREDTLDNVMVNNIIE